MIVAVLLGGCLINDALYQRERAALTDADGDGFLQREVCDDGDGGVFPGAGETCDGVDEDCDGETDEGASDAPTWYGDGDGDGYGVVAGSVVGCSDPGGGYSAVGDDCDDANASAYPGGAEVAYDAVDQDCDGADLVDVDGDGWAAEVVGGEDCDDSDPEVSPEGGETCADGIDQDCSGADLLDCDRDGFDAQDYGGADCDDGDASVYPDAPEGWPDFGMDNGCDGRVDDRISLALGAADVVVDPPAGAAYFGDAFTFGGDVDGDGEADLWVSAPLDRNAGGNAGAVYRLPSATIARGGMLDVSLVGSGVTGTGPDELLGGSISVGEFDSGTTLIVGSALANDAAGVVWALEPDALSLGAFASIDTLAMRILHGEPGQFPGSRLIGGDDVNGDGRSDVILDVLGDSSVAGFASMGTEDAALADADWVWQGSVGDYLYPTVAGDVNGDGYADVAVVNGSVRAGELGVEVVAGGPELSYGAFGAQTLLGLYGPSSMGPMVEVSPGVRWLGVAQFQGSVFVNPITPGRYDPLVDADYQLFRDAAEGAFESASVSAWMGAVGPAVLFCGPSSDDGADRGDCVAWQSDEFAAGVFARDVQLHVLGEGPGDTAGRRQSANVDINADGAADVVVSAPLHDSSGPDAGRFYIEFAP